MLYVWSMNEIEEWNLGRKIICKGKILGQELIIVMENKKQENAFFPL